MSIGLSVHMKTWASSMPLYPSHRSNSRSRSHRQPISCARAPICTSRIPTTARKRQSMYPRTRFCLARPLSRVSLARKPQICRISSSQSTHPLTPLLSSRCSFITHRVRPTSVVAIHISPPRALASSRICTLSLSLVPRRQPLQRSSPAPPVAQNTD